MLIRSRLEQIIAVSAPILLAVLLLLIMLAPAKAADPAIEAWFKSLKRPGTQVSCCDISDCARTKARIGPAGWEAMTPAGTWIAIPEDRILRIGDNPTGEPVLCLSPYQMVYCFVPPAET